MDKIKISAAKTNEPFISYMKKAANALRTGKTKDLEEVKAAFAKQNISLFYNEGSDKFRVLRRDSPYIDFFAKQFTKIPLKKKK